jgi:hypothetical protein
VKLPSPVSEDDQRAVRRLASLSLEYAGYCYFAATILEFFETITNESMKAAERASVDGGGVEALSVARRTFGDDPRIAWNKVSAFRRARGLEVVPTPPEGVLLPTLPPPASSRASAVARPKRTHVDDAARRPYERTT